MQYGKYQKLTIIPRASTSITPFCSAADNLTRTRYLHDNVSVENGLGFVLMVYDDPGQTTRLANATTMQHKSNKNTYEQIKISRRESYGWIFVSNLMYSVGVVSVLLLLPHCLPLLMIRDQYVMKIYLLVMMHIGYNNGFCLYCAYTMVMCGCVQKH